MIDDWSVVQRHIAQLPTNVVAIIRELRINYVEFSNIPNQSGYFARHNGSFEIGVNASESPQRKRFTAAHELGHYMLHRDLLGEGQHFDRLYGAGAMSNPVNPFTQQHEIQANRFAADILMPASYVQAIYNRRRSIQDVVSAFHVSEPAAKIRLRNLGIIHD